MAFRNFKKVKIGNLTENEILNMTIHESVANLVQRFISGFTVKVHEKTNFVYLEDLSRKKHFLEIAFTKNKGIKVMQWLSKKEVEFETFKNDVKEMESDYIMFAVVDQEMYDVYLCFLNMDADTLLEDMSTTENYDRDGYVFKHMAAKYEGRITRFED